ncbi:uncharacterized protein LOC123560041 isoform X2 [Mercenaria mercenaria]|uniref:uncharacterized protein LOC123560041 isoform X2 n=1 Tax=Mercenaria mercenaria TaxID=6596 RepID=UPI00234E4E7D|nr:uncharacterized protein LOC123560041 isoform X2 [Mercenaria mercenaria]
MFYQLIIGCCLLLFAILIYIKWKKRRDEEERKRKMEEEWNRGLKGLAVGACAGLGAYVIKKTWEAVTNNEEPDTTSTRGSVRRRRLPPAVDWANGMGFDGEDFTALGRPVQSFSWGFPGSSATGESRLNVCDIGVNFDDWRIPKELSVSELSVAKRICDASETELNIDNGEWNKATETVNKVLNMLMAEIKCEARKYGLFIEKYVKQGSSREGLKVHAPDEFDVLLQYSFENLEYKVVNKSVNGKLLPELAYLRLDEKELCELSDTHSRLYNKNVFEKLDGNLYLNARQLHEKVFKSMIAAASASVESKVNQGERRDKFGFKINLSTNPPSENIRIKLIEKDDVYTAFDRLYDIQLEDSLKIRPEALVQQKETIIDVDIVPGLLFSEDVVPNPVDKDGTMLCPTYAVFKWRTENDRSAFLYGGEPHLLWRVCSSGYEKHVIDVARGKREQMHIINALRLLKLYFRNMNQRAKDQNEPPPQVVTVLRSYHLKHIAFYCILFLRVLKKVQVSDVKVSLAYMLEFLGICLEERKLPHFFQANEHICLMFPRLELQPNALRYDLFQGKRGDSLNQARLSYLKMKKEMFSVIGELVVPDVVQLFRTYIASGNYYG